MALVVQAKIMTESLQQMAEASMGEMSNDLKLAEAVNEAADAHVQSLSASLNGWAPLQEVLSGCSTHSLQHATPIVVLSVLHCSCQHG